MPGRCVPVQCVPQTKSLGGSVPWTMRPLDYASLGYYILVSLSLIKQTMLIIDYKYNNVFSACCCQLQLFDLSSIYFLQQLSVVVVCLLGVGCQVLRTLTLRCKCLWFSQFLFAAGVSCQVLLFDCLRQLLPIFSFVGAQLCVLAR